MSLDVGTRVAGSEDDHLHGALGKDERKRWNSCTEEVVEAAFKGFLSVASVASAIVYAGHRTSPAISRIPAHMKAFAVMAVGLMGFRFSGDQAELDCARRLSLAHLNAKRAAEGKPPLPSFPKYD